MKKQILLMVMIALLSFTLVSAKPLTCEDYPDIEALWNFDDTFVLYEAKDYCGGHNGTINSINNATGYYDLGFGFDGFSGDGFLVEFADIIYFEDNDFSISAWIYHQNANSNQSILHKLNSGTFKGVSFGLGTTDTPNEVVIGGSMGNGTILEELPSNITIDEFTWTHVVMVRENQNMYFYKNGVLGDVVPFNSVNVTTDEELYVGSIFTAQYFFNGIMDDLAIWNTALNSSQVLEIYADDTLITNRVTNPISPQIYDDGLTIEFNATITSNINIIDVKLNFFGVDYDTTNNGDVYTAQLIITGTGDFPYYWTSTDELNHTITSTTQQYEVTSFEGEIVYSGEDASNIYGITRSVGAGLGKFFEYMTTSLPLLLFGLAVVGIFVAVGFSIALVFRKFGGLK